MRYFAPFLPGVVIDIVVMMVAVAVVVAVLHGTGSSTSEWQ